MRRYIPISETGCVCTCSPSLFSAESEKVVTVNDLMDFGQSNSVVWRDLHGIIINVMFIVLYKNRVFDLSLAFSVVAHVVIQIVQSDFRDVHWQSSQTELVSVKPRCRITP